MSSAFQRGLVLWNQSNYEHASREFRRVLAESPDDVPAHVLLSLCLGNMPQPEAKLDALREAEEAIRLDPEYSYAHYARAIALQHLDRFRDGETAIGEAIRLEPEKADYRASLAGILAARRRWPEALDAADTGLAIDAENVNCLNLRALALVNLGRKAEAAATLGNALADDPEDPLTHANQGWTYLHRGDPAKALEHFRESLRLDPTNEWARLGIVEALKAQHLIYRLMLGFFLWMGRQSSRAQWAVILGFVFGRKILADLAEAHPALAPWVTPIIALSFGFLMLTWVASPVFNFLLQFNRFGRMALTRDERVESNVIGLCVIGALGCFAAYAPTGDNLAFFGMAFCGFLLPPLAVTFRQPWGRPRLWMAAYAVILVGLCIPIFAFVLFGPASPFGDLPKSLELFSYFLYGSMLSTWIPSLIGLRDAR